MAPCAGHGWVCADCPDVTLGVVRDMILSLVRGVSRITPTIGTPETRWG